MTPPFTRHPVASAMLVCVAVLKLGGAIPQAAQAAVMLDGYAEWRHEDYLVVDGQRVRETTETQWPGRARSISATPLGDEVRVRGTRGPDGSVLGSVIDVRANGGNQVFERDVRSGADQLERAWLRTGRVFESDDEGHTRGIGEVIQAGVEVDRVRGILHRLIPPYVDQNRLRTYVIKNRDWNAMAMPNGAIWVYNGLLDDLSDDELAVVIGHELVHYTHEHGRRQSRRGVWTQLAGVAAALTADAVDSPKGRAVVRVGAALALAALSSGYGRDLEDQADRVGVRYAYEGGFDVSVAPHVWARFEARYGNENRVTNFFFSDHSRARDRRKNLEAEISVNYRSSSGSPLHFRSFP